MRFLLSTCGKGEGDLLAMPTTAVKGKFGGVGAESRRSTAGCVGFTARPKTPNNKQRPCVIPCQMEPLCSFATEDLISLQYVHV